jgi:hypothetical protein
MDKSLLVRRDDSAVIYILGPGTEISLLDPGAVIRLTLDPSAQGITSLISFTNRAAAAAAFENIASWLAGTDAQFEIQPS